MPAGYPHPPITEAIIEFRFDGTGAQKNFEAATKRLMKAYPRTEDLRQIEIILNGETATTSVTPDSPIVRKMTSADGADIVLLDPARVAVSRLAPYIGWEKFIAHFRNVLTLASAIVKKRSLTRIGVRFINRIDVPADEYGMFDHGDYLRIGLAPLPFDHGPIGGLAFSVTSLLEMGKFGLVLNCSKAASPLIGHAALIVDIEIFNQNQLPSTQEQIWAQVGEFRVWKNRVFENTITDLARKLFR